MAEYINIKLVSGDDIIGVLDYDDDDMVAVMNPIQIEIDPREGMFAKSYLMLSEENTCVFYRSDIVHLARANKKACEYYEEFIAKLGKLGEEYEDEEESSFNDELEDMFTTMLESKVSTKH